jgi:hypothetical protein
MEISEYNEWKICAVRFRETGEVLTVYQFELRSKFNRFESSGSVLERISSAGADPVFESEAPSVSGDQIAEWDGAVKIGENWHRKWKITDAPGRTTSENQFKLSQVREKRNKVLSLSDWTQFNDSPLSDETKRLWAVYRQQLRDITIQPIDNIVWPKSPTDP